jgi:hypothetical protein
MSAKLYRTREGRTLCSAHYSSGAPSYHTDGCDTCAQARAKGIVRPNIETVPRKQRGRRQHLDKRIDWDKVKPENRAALASNIAVGRRGFAKP